MRRIIFAAAALAAALTTVPAAAQDRVELGMLNCLVQGGAGFVVGSSKELSCTFTSADRAKPPEPYFGVVNKFGLDVGATNDAVMQWAVLAPTSNAYQLGALTGDYVGASAEATAAVGVGANVLVGGSDRTFSLQPVSVQAQTGLNLALGVTEFQLRSGVN
ncbi:DUF992 domain-containing protein [Aquamicrobium sp. LC103]|uniref:DUF992 domain-containing protein n=1 Tax=Aquamicrobium sp. LC103 TaxID=1120658 RepID=UPI00063EB6E4|nr:DUF992 domain-containing protein [Aquamicrobium sp. LC103]TKT77585.1 DUF992 domain-containing protein [Aquamicrobium sp. LC103]